MTAFRRLTHAASTLVRAHVGPTAIVLTYHRVAALRSDPQLLAVSPEHFAAHLQVLAERYRVLPLQELVAALGCGRVQDKTVAVTFDDGYADNLENAMPLLEQAGVPATVFVGSGQLGGPEYWWDELERVVLLGGQPPEFLQIVLPSGTFSESATTSGHAETAESDLDSAWDVLRPPGTRSQRLYVELCDFLRSLGHSEREMALEQIRSAFGTPLRVRPTHRTLSPEEVRMLDASAVIDVGAHSFHHDELAMRSMAEQTRAIVDDKAFLEEVCGHSVHMFSYPYGESGSFSDETVSIVKQAGFLGACANYPAPVKSRTDPFRIPRYVVRDWTGAEFGEHLARWFGGTGPWHGAR